MKSKRESGLVVVEAAIIVTLVMIILTIMLYVGMVLYQQTLVSVMANQTAANIAQVYSNNLKDPFTGYVDPDRIYQSVTYSSMKTDAYKAVVEQKANIFARYRLKSSKILAGDNATVEVELVKKPNDLLKSQVVVTVHDHYDVPLVGFFGVNGLMEFAASGRADCVDILDYIYTVEAVGDPDTPPPVAEFNNCIVTFIPDSDDAGNIQVQTVLKGHSIASSNRYTSSVMPRDPEKGDLKFAGWFTEDRKPFTASTQIDDNTVVYGRWTCKLTFVTNAEGALVNGKERDTMEVPYGTRANFPVPSRRGYSFDGWFDASGNAYFSNDTLVTQNVTLTAAWTCIHLERYEVRTGSVCAGGTIYYKCKTCDADLGSESYTGECNTWFKCDTEHETDCFDGREDGGCWGYHVPGQWCGACGRTHKNVYYYHVMCEYCKSKSGSYWCGNMHCSYTRNKRPAHPCK